MNCITARTPQILAVVVILALIKMLVRKRKVKPEFPGPIPYPILGNLLDLARAGGFNSAFFRELHKKHGAVCAFSLGFSKPNLSISRCRTVMQVYQKTRDRPIETEWFLGFLGKENLLFQHGPAVARLRKRYTSMLSGAKVLERVHLTASTHFQKLAKSWEQKEVDVFKAVGSALYDIMGEVLFGSAWSTSEKGPKIYSLHKHLIQNADNFVVYRGIGVNPVWSAEYRDYEAKTLEWHSLVQSLLETKMEEVLQAKAKANDFEETPKDVLTVLAQAVVADDENFPKGMAVSTLCGFLNGAYDTTHSTLVWALFHLAKHVRTQEKVRLEIQDKMGIPEKSTALKARSLVYLDAFLRESMRLMPTVPVNQRCNLEEGFEVDVPRNPDFPSGKLEVPKNTNVNIPMDLVFKDPECFGPDVDAFRVERFLGDSEKARTARKFCTAFGAFGRKCVGSSFALAELRAILVVLLQDYEIRLGRPDIDVLPKLEAGVNQPSTPIPLRFSPLPQTKTQRRKG